MPDVDVCCPLCGAQFSRDAAYSAHLSDEHDLVDEVGAAPGLDVSVLAAGAVALAQPDAPHAPEVPPTAELSALVSPDGADTAPPPATTQRSSRRGAALALILLLLPVVGAAWWALRPDADRDVDRGESPATGPALDGGFGLVVGDITTTTGSTVPVTAPSTTTTVPSTTAPAPTPPSAPVTPPPAPPPTSPPPTRPPAPPPTTITATGATVVSCTRDGGQRTLVYSYVLSGSAADGRHQASVAAQGRVRVDTVRAPAPGGGLVTVTLQPGPVECR